MKKILIIEDEPAYLRLLHEQLTRSGYEIIEAKDGAEGLTVAKSHHPDLILLDLVMPIMDGATMLRELRKDEYGKSTKVIILTNLDPDDRILQTVLACKPIYYLMKSNMQLSELMEKIKEVLSK